MKYVTLAARLLLGFLFVSSGVTFFFTAPPALEGPAGEFFKGLLASQYFLYLLKGTEIVCGLSLLSGFFVPLALVILAPVVLNIFFVQIFLFPENLGIGAALGALETYLAFFSKEYSPVIKSLFRPK